MDEGRTGRSGLWLVVLAVLALLGVVGYFALSGPATPPADAPAATPLTQADPAMEKPPGFQATETTAPVPLDVTPDSGVVRPPTPLEVGDGAAPPEPAAPGVVARGKVIWRGGRLPPDTDVLLYDSEGYDLEQTTTEEDGSFELVYTEPLAPGWSFGTDPIDVEHNGAKLSLVPVIVGNLPAHAPGDPPVTRDLLVGFAPTLSGMVTDAVSKQPIEGAEVWVGSSMPPWTYEVVDAITGPDGRYVLPLEGPPLQGLMLWCRADGYRTTLIGPLELPAVATPGETVTQDFALGAETVLRGRVTDIAGGAPIADATITAGNRHSVFADWGDWELSDEDGSFEIDVSELPELDGWLVVAAEGYAPLALPMKSDGGFIEARLGPPAIVAGTVTDQDGNPAVHASVRVAFAWDTPALELDMYDEAYCDEQGRFDLVLEVVPVEQAVLRIENLNYLPLQVPLAEAGKPLPGNRWDVAIKLTSL